MVDLNKVLALHERHTGVLDIKPDLEVKNAGDLGLAYTPGVAEISKLIKKEPGVKSKYTMSGKLVALVTDGTAVLGLGNMGPAGGLPIVEGKALLYKELAGVAALPLCIEQVSPDEAVQTIKNIAQSFAGIHLEDIAAPQCFEIEAQLAKSLDIPVYHDDQEGTAIVVLAALINAAKLVNKNLPDLKVVINGMGAAGVATARLLVAIGMKNLTLIDIKGKVTAESEFYNRYQKELAVQVNQAEGNTLDELIERQDVFIGLSDANILSGEHVARMAENAIVFALANPVPEIDPDLAKANGAKIIATGSSQWENQVNNVLVFPGLFKGLLTSGVKSVSYELQKKVAGALAALIKNPNFEHVIPGVFDEGVVETVTQAVINFAANK